MDLLERLKEATREFPDELIRAGKANAPIPWRRYASGKATIAALHKLGYALKEVAPNAWIAQRPRSQQKGEPSV